MGLEMAGNPRYIESNRSRTLAFVQTNGRWMSGSAMSPRSMKWRRPSRSYSARLSGDWLLQSPGHGDRPFARPALEHRPTAVEEGCAVAVAELAVAHEEMDVRLVQFRRSSGRSDHPGASASGSATASM